ncbi:S8 family serine peptidase [Geoalkalibacter sp.]|uniref:S8 family serine peptidase n=1 Tax=Geoalkalibacter sp. TaxID=3041440 RepID=UPI00272E700D|nr:S8 family serine peptidase [Geoalkalibacter sp.]
MTIFRLFSRAPGLLTLALIFFLSTSAGSLAAELDPGLAAQMQAAAPGETLPVILLLSPAEEVVRLAEKHGRKQRGALVRELKERARRTEQPLVALLRQHGIVDITSLWLVNGLAFSASPALLDQLRDLEEVAALHLDEAVAPVEVAPSFAHFVAGWNVNRVQAPALWNLGYRGAGRVVALLDSGVDLNHPQLGPRWRGGVNSWFDPFDNTTQPSDFRDLGEAGQSLAHGTAVAGVLVAGANLGVAPEAQWIAARIFHPTRTPLQSHILAALAWVLDPDGNPATDDAPDVLNGSWGLTSQNVCNQAYRPAIQALKAAGIAVVFAAGNSGPAAATSESPANYPESFAVGASDSQDLVASFSARGPSPSACGQGLYPDVVAPGVGITTTDLDGTFASVAGTSFAAPHVAGILALLMEAFPTAPVAHLEQALRVSAVDLGVPGPDQSAGYGLVNAAAAHAYLAFTPPPQLLGPAEGAAVLAEEVVLRWRQLPDSFGVPVVNRVLISTDAAFSAPLVILAWEKGGTGGAVLLATGGGGLLVWLGWLGVGARKSRRWRMLVTALLVALLLACGGGGGGGGGGGDTFPVGNGGTPVDPNLRELVLADLTPGTLYYWKVVAENARGGLSESAVRTFRVE